MSIIILVTATTQRLERCLASLEAAGAGGPTAEILVLANGTSAAALSRVAGRDDIVLLRSPVNHGFGGGCNWAARFARGSRLVFINDDASAGPGWLTALDVAMSADAAIGVVGGRVLFGDGRLQEAGNVIWRDGSTSHIGRGLPADTPTLLTRRDVAYVSFCAAMVRRQTWDDVGGFDERYFPAYYEDADLCLSARALGWRVVCEPAAVVVHEEGASTPVELRHFLSVRNQHLFAAKWRSTLAASSDRPVRLTTRAVLKAAAHGAPPASADANARALPVERIAQRSPDRHRPRRAATQPAEADALALERRHLAADVAMKGEYTAYLEARLRAFGTGTLLRRRYRAARRAIGAQVRRHPAVARTVQRLRARIRDSA